MCACICAYGLSTAPDTGASEESVAFVPEAFM